MLGNQFSTLPIESVYSVPMDTIEHDMNNPREVVAFKRRMRRDRSLRLVLVLVVRH